VWEQRKTDFDLDVVEGGRARGSFAPDKRESVSTLIKNPPPGAPAPPIMRPVDGYLLLDWPCRAVYCCTHMAGCIGRRYLSI
jgi:hypothetical protein